jgi:hypothetical protein
MTEEEHGWLEYQGYAFAGLVLVPREPLVKHAGEWVKRIKAKGISLVHNWDFAWELITEHLGKEFQVSASVIEKRLEKDGIKSGYKESAPPPLLESQDLTCYTPSTIRGETL